MDLIAGHWQAEHDQRESCGRNQAFEVGLNIPWAARAAEQVQYVKKRATPSGDVGAGRAGGSLYFVVCHGRGWDARGDPEVAGWRRGQSRAIDFERGGFGGRGAKPYSAECDGLHVVLLPEGLSFPWWQEPPPLDQPLETSFRAVPEMPKEARTGMEVAKAYLAYSS